MNTTFSTKKAVTVVLGVAAVPALLVAGAGAAQADSGVWTTTDALGVTAHVASYNGIFGPAAGGACSYTAIPDPGTTDPGFLPPLPVYAMPFHMTPGVTHDIWFPGIQTGTDWAVTVNCAQGIASPTEHETY